MEGENQDRNKVVLGAVLGGLLMGTAYYFWKNQDEKQTMLEKVGKRIADVGEKLEDSTIHSRKEAIKTIENSIPKKSKGANQVISWVATGLNLWEQFKKRD